MQNDAPDKDPAALSAVLDALRSDDAGKLDHLLQTQGWIKNEVVHADGESAVIDRMAKGWLQSIAAGIPAILIESLVRRNLRGEVGDTLLLVATKSGKIAVRAKLAERMLVAPAHENPEEVDDKNLPMATNVTLIPNTNGASKPAGVVEAARCVETFKCIHSNGVALRRSADKDDKVDLPRGPEHNDIVHGVRVPGKESEWIVIENDQGKNKKNEKERWIGKYLTLKIMYESMFEVVKAIQSDASEIVTEKSAPAASKSEGETKDPLVSESMPHTGVFESKRGTHSGIFESGGFFGTSKWTCCKSTDSKAVECSATKTAMEWSCCGQRVESAVQCGEIHVPRDRKTIREALLRVSVDQSSNKGGERSNKKSDLGLASVLEHKKNWGYENTIKKIVIGKGTFKVDGEGSKKAYLKVMVDVEMVGVSPEETILEGGIQLSPGSAFQQVVLKNCTVQSSKGSGIKIAKDFMVGPLSDRILGLVMDNVVVEKCANHGLNFENNVISAHNVVIRQNGKCGVYLSSGATMTISGASSKIHHNCGK